MYANNLQQREYTMLLKQMEDFIFGDCQEPLISESNFDLAQSAYVELKSKVENKAKIVNASDVEENSAHLIRGTPEYKIFAKYNFLGKKLSRIILKNLGMTSDLMEIYRILNEDSKKRGKRDIAAFMEITENGILDYDQ